MKIASTLNADFIDTQYKLWKSHPEKVSRDWQFFFEGFELATARNDRPVGINEDVDSLKQANVQALIHRYRDVGHLMACLDPLVACPTDHPLLNLDAFDLSVDDLDREFVAVGLTPSSRASLRDIIGALRDTYCHSTGVEFMHLQDPAERQWLIDRMEPEKNRTRPDPTQKQRIFEKLSQATQFEQFLNKKYIGVTRFSLEGGEAIIPALDSLAERLAVSGVKEIILGMAHRGRLNIQANILNKPLQEIFAEFENCYDPDSLFGSGDVKYHNGYLADIKTGSGQDLRIFLVNNPSHLESVNPVVEGFARARQDLLNSEGRRQVLPLLIHGDAAFAGQGVVAETLNMSQLEGYKTGGTIHLVINNQIGYTTLPEHARSTRYSTDIAKMLMVPIFHVHGEDPEAVVQTVQLAADYRMEFGKDTVIDIICYRKYGHNEGDEPYFTQPQMYERIRERPSLSKSYAERLLEENVTDKKTIDQISKNINAELNTAYDEIHGNDCLFPEVNYYENWEGYNGKYSHDAIDTGLKNEQLLSLATGLNTVPTGFTINPKLERLLQKRQAAVEKGEGIDWANAESLAFAGLLTEGFSIRLSGQDSGRGTFSQRHSVLVDSKTGNRYTPLQSLDGNQAVYHVYDSHLSEVGVLGFEYGYSIARPDTLTLWEAQFGDFVNNAQSVIDLFIVSGETKWQRLSGLVLLLPHGFEGLGPEHSSARPERFLQLCAGDNIQVCYPTTPGQYFHLLRRQAKSRYRKPLVILTPKSLLRHPLAVSSGEELANGDFQAVISEDIEIKKNNKVIFCSGKIYYDLLKRRMELGKSDIAIIRLEQFYPFPESQLAEVVKNYAHVKKWFWVQEEPENMGGWSFIKRRIESAIGRYLKYIGRKEASSPASGFPHIFRAEQTAILDQAIGRLAARGAQAEVG